MSARHLLISGLVLINIMLAALLVDRIGFYTPAASAQGFNSSGQYAIVSGSTPDGGYVYVLDQNAGVISGLVIPYNHSNPQYLIPRNVGMDISRARVRNP
ncbi:MAG TPA: hypothetical protein VKJ65_10835 [Phycisphaerae bacterium]|nr:hypothetical protein [Phycisphaerae bacterium]